MARYMMLVKTDAVAGREDAYHDWYDNTHIPEVVAVPGVVSGTRLDKAPGSPNPQPAEHLAIYELDTDDPATVIAEISRRAQSGEMRMSDALGPAEIWLYKVR